MVYPAYSDRDGDVRDHEDEPEEADLDAHPDVDQVVDGDGDGEGHEGREGHEEDDNEGQMPSCVGVDLEYLI